MKVWPHLCIFKFAVQGHTYFKQIVPETWELPKIAEMPD